MSLIIDIPTIIEEPMQNRLRRRIIEMVDVTVAGLLFVRISKINGSDLPGGAPARVLYRVTLCGVGGVPLADAREFFLFQTPSEEQLKLQYIQKRSC